MKTYSSLRKPVTFMYFWLNYCDENRIEKLPVAVKSIDHLFNLASEIIKADRPHLFLLSDDTPIDDNEYLEYRINCLHGRTNRKTVNLF